MGTPGKVKGSTEVSYFGVVFYRVIYSKIIINASICTHSTASDENCLLAPKQQIVWQRLLNDLS